MASTSEALAERLLGSCLAGECDIGLASSLLAQGGSRQFFRTVVEALSDSFEPRLCDVYARLMAAILPAHAEGLSAAGLLTRYQRIRRPRRCDVEPVRVVVLSRVTLGADASITSVILDAAKRRFPGAPIELAGSRKAWELFAADPRIGHLPVEYPRSGDLAGRLVSWRHLRAELSRPGTLVLDPDSRLTQLGMLPVCPDENYFFFESRSYGGDGPESLTELARQWVRQTLDVEPGWPYVASGAGPDPGRLPVVAMSLGIGENPAKRIGDPFEQRLCQALIARGARLFLDKGAGGEETERVEQLLARFGNHASSWQGAFAPFASAISRCSLYVGYDSAGQHVAAAWGVPLVTVFAGFPSERMFQRWQPSGRGPKAVVRVDNPDPDAVLAQTLAAVDNLAVL